PDSGSIQLNGMELTRLSPDDKTLLRRNRIGFVFQFFHLLPSMTAVENVELPLQLNGFKAAERNRLAHEILKQVGVDHRSDAFPREMSGGEMQRVAIARALVVKPQLLLADEPTGNLDAKSGDAILNLLESLSELHEVGLLMVTHQPDTTRICHRTLHMRDGKIVESTQRAES
ncbi:MAG: ATP-binding cassette domain-containing protein, partial [Verrucomicrobiae bacterium]|nr:ATP-binding cassette domain-containing protein [Verrucomicrobiae bacterium]